MITGRKFLFRMSGFRQVKSELMVVPPGSVMKTFEIRLEFRSGGQGISGNLFHSLGGKFILK